MDRPSHQVHAPVQGPLRRRPGRARLIAGVSVIATVVVMSGVLVPTRPGSHLLAPAAAVPEDKKEEGKKAAPAPEAVASPSPGGALVLAAVATLCYWSSFRRSQALGMAEAKEDEGTVTTSIKPPRIPAFDSLRFFLIAYISSGHFIHTATKNAFLLRLVTQINVVVGAFFVLSGYVLALTTTEMRQRKGTKRLDNAVEFAVSRIMGVWPLHVLVIAIFAPMFLWVDTMYGGPLVALWHGFLSLFMLQAWFPTSAEIWNAPTWFLSAYNLSLCVLPYALRVLALQRRAELRRTLVFLTLLSVVPKLGYSYDLKSWLIMEGTLNAKTHPNYALFNVLRFSPFAAIPEVLMGAVACRLVMLDGEQDSGKGGSPLWPLAAMLGIMWLRAAGLVEMNDLLVRSVFFIPLWIVFLMRIHRESTAPGGSEKLLPKMLCNKTLLYLGGISFPIFIVHGPIGQLFYKKAVATAVFGGMMSTPLQKAVHPFFGVYWICVLITAGAMQKWFVESPRVKKFAKGATEVICRKIS